MPITSTDLGGWFTGQLAVHFTFSTPEETAYPLPLAYRIAYLLAQELVLRGWEPPPLAFCPPENVSYQYLRSIVGVQPKSSKIAPLVSEFRKVACIQVPMDCVLLLQPGEKLQSPWFDIPSGSCLLKKPPIRSNGGNNNGNQSRSPPQVKPLQRLDDSSTASSKVLHFGVYRSCEQFISAAALAGHPAGGETRLPKALGDVLKFLASRSLKEVAKHRSATLNLWLDRSRKLVADEKSLHESLHPSMRGILAPKRLLLWKEMMEHYHYPDVSVFDEVVSGITLSGAAPDVPLFEPGFKPAKITEGELALSAKASRVALLASIRSSGDDEIDREVFSKTQDEVACGWLEGPIEESSLEASAVISRRFGIRQSSGEVAKIRLIDDFTASNVNQTVQVENSPKLHTLDIVAALCMELLRQHGGAEWVGKTIDLSSAYRQLGVSPHSRWVSYIAVFDPSSKKAKIYSMRALPFGASRSVYAFLRVAHSLWWLGCVALKFPWSSFFDDFITLCRKGEAPTMEIATEQFFRLLGNLPFSESFKALGVEIDCSQWLLGRVLFRNTQKRVAELRSTIGQAIETGKLSAKSALALRGRMQFAKGQIWGRSAKLCLTAVTAHAYGDTGDSLSKHALDCLSAFQDSLMSAKPREITASWDKPMLLFTDASFNPEDAKWPCGLGGVLCDETGRQLAAISISLNADDLNALGYPAKSTVIFEAELLALVLCVKIWRKLLRNRPCVMYVDNNGTRDVAISGSARSWPGSALAAALLRQEDAACLTAWYARVPSASNIADAPSRNSTDGIQVKLMSPDLVRPHLDKLIGNLKLNGQSGECG